MSVKGILSAVELSHREAIRELLARYCYLHTDHDFDGIAALFTEDGCFESLVGPCIGRQAIRDYYLKVVGHGDASPDRKHFISEVLIDLAGEEAKVTCQFLLVRQVPPEPVEGAGSVVEVSAAGRYHDQLVLQDGEWRFRHRKVLVDHRGDMGLRGPH